MYTGSTKKRLPAALLPGCRKVSLPKKIGAHRQVKNRGVDGAS
ncbi:hypothetical protein ELI_4180 [Eubacterium callanderi]|uniref:Uncharacterized protein n=1 Tax=Eubacterium callanderi TaxID=53442 RepID=E3GQ73_9FIRM|nr:hypothetical protein ELI_4180 [Eubacterium callanderi]